MYYYQEYSPAPQLTPWVKNYWVVNGFLNSEIIPKVFPDGCTDIIFIFDRTKGTSYAKIFGTMTTFTEVDYPNPTQMFGIRFKPAGITAFTRVPIDELTNRTEELSSVETLFDKSFYEALPEKQSVEEIVTFTNSYLMNQLPCLYNVNRQIIRAIDMISLSKGQLNLAGVASNVYLSQRHFERKFKATVGVSPKMFAKIFRFKYASQCMLMYPSKDFLTIAVECGYYDHRHLIKDFKSLSGDTPDDFRRKKSFFYTYRNKYIL